MKKTPKIDESIQKMIPELIETRRDFHMHPEIGMKEFRTAKIIAKRLEELGYEVRTAVGETGVVALLRGNGDRTVAFRADMDALPVQELNECDYKSQIDGMLHGCGHDGHMSILLGFARWVAERPEPFPGNIKLIFQPGEEGYGGAVKMIKDGALDDPPVEQIFGLHLWNDFPVGMAGVSAGPGMASVDGFEITVFGKGGHAAMPHQTIDALVVAAHITIALQTVVSRNIDPLVPAVVSVTRIEGGNADNAIAETVKIRGMARAFDSDLRAEMAGMVQRCAQGVAEGLGAKIGFEWTPLYPVTSSDAHSAGLVRNAVIDVLGTEEAIQKQQTMGAEDFSFFLEKVPGCFFFLGSSNADKNLAAPHHNPYFDFDEEVLPIGVAIFARCAEKFFENIK